MWLSSPHLKQPLSPPLRPPEGNGVCVSAHVALQTKLKAASTTKAATTHRSGVCVGTLTLYVTFLSTLKTTCVRAVLKEVSFLVGLETRSASSSFSRTVTTGTTFTANLLEPRPKLELGSAFKPLLESCSNQGSFETVVPATLLL
ncbi:hypothetical protein MRX96_056018 [Rhipicephalus microplus]